MAEGSGSRTHQTRRAHLAEFEVRALHRDTIPFRFVTLPALLLHLRLLCCCANQASFSIHQKSA